MSEIGERWKRVAGALVCALASMVCMERVEEVGGTVWVVLTFVFAARAGAFWDRAIPDVLVSKADAPP